jgi:protein-L-isoaspartate O-methyltransferase
MKRLDDEYFERIYQEAEDPWGFATRWYEQRKYALTLAALPRERYRRAFEPGCSFGVLSELLAVRCDALIASDLVASVSARAAQRLRHFDHVRVDTGAIPDVWPEGHFDLIVLSEVAYYLSLSRSHPRDRGRVAAPAALRPAGRLRQRGQGPRRRRRVRLGTLASARSEPGLARHDRRRFAGRSGLAERTHRCSRWRRRSAGRYDRGRRLERA